MYFKLAKILALGLGAVITTGMPSGMIPDDSTAQPEIQLVMPYETQDMTADWYVEAGPKMKMENIKPAVVVNFGVFEQGPKLGEAPAPTDLTQKDLGPLLLKSPDREKKPVNPITIPRLRVVITLPGITPNRAAAPKAAYVLDGQLKPDNYSGTIVPVSSDSFDYPEYYYEPIYVGAQTRQLLGAPSLPQESSAAETGAVPGKPGNAGSGGSGGSVVAAVPEPAGFIAILAGLPGLSVLTRRGRR